MNNSKNSSSKYKSQWNRALVVTEPFFYFVTQIQQQIIEQENNEWRNLVLCIGCWFDCKMRA